MSEALTNVGKYAQASRATVAVRRTERELVVEVRDDGVGGADVRSGTGLRGLEDRLAALDGTLRIESPRGRGTRVEARIPYGAGSVAERPAPAPVAAEAPR